jgi:hypothetical protein
MPRPSEASSIRRRRLCGSPVLNVAPAFLALPACGCGGGLALSEDAGPEDVRSDAAGPTFSDVAQTSPDVPVSPDLPQALPDASPASADVAASPDLPWAPDRPPSDARPPVDLPNPADGSGDPGRYYERPDVFTHEARPLDSGSVDASAVVTEYPLRISDCSPQAIVAGPDGDLWFTEARGRIGRITPAGGVGCAPPSPGRSSTAYVQRAPSTWHARMLSIFAATTSG